MFPTGRGDVISSAWVSRAGDRVFKPMAYKPMTYKIDSFHFPVWCSALLEYGKDWLAQCQNNVTGWNIRTWCWQHDFPVRQHYKFTMSAHCHKSVPVMIWPEMLLGRKRTNTLYSFGSVCRKSTESTDHVINFNWSIYGSGWLRQVEYHYNGIVWACVWGVCTVV